MGIRIYIDDLRDPSTEEFDYICRNDRMFDKIIDCCVFYGITIDYISFDHDLGNNSEDGYTITKRLVDLELSGFKLLSDDFTFNVHSANPVGSKNIESYLNNYLKHKTESKNL